MTVVTFTTPGAGSITVNGGGPNDPPSGVTSIQIECWGAGGSPLSTVAAETGGGSGAYSRLNTLTVSNGDVIRYSVGDGELSGSGGTVTQTTFVAYPDAFTVVCSAPRGTLGSGGSGGVGDVKFNGANGVAAQGGGGSRGGGGGSSSAGPSGAGVAGAAGSGASGGAGAAGGTDVGGGGNGAPGATAVNGSNGSSPGGGAGGGGSGSPSNGGNAGDGQVRFTWTAAPADTLMGQACL